jgi:hypothetical protein
MEPAIQDADPLHLAFLLSQVSNDVGNSITQP